MSGNIQYSKMGLFLLGLICVGALFARMDGVKWPKLHPDEPVIGAWLDQSARNVYIKDRVYPNGFFALARPFVLAGKAFFRVKEKFDYQCGSIDRVRGAMPDGIYFGRWFNVWAGTLLCVVMFLLVARITRSQGAGLLAAGLAGFAQYAVEHSHYAETDMAAVLTLALALWFLIVASDTGRPRWFVAAALAGGFAAGTKFTLLALAPLVLLEAVLFVRPLLCRTCETGRSEWRFSSGWWPALGFVGLSCLLFGVGFILANPAVLLDFKWFWAGLAAEKQRVFAETALNLGPLAIKPAVKYLHHLDCLQGYLRTLGYPWLVLLAVGVPCAALRSAHRSWTVLLLFPVFYAVYWIFMAPWVRSQEFLLFLPSFAALAALPLAILWRAKNYFSRGFALMIAVLALTVNGYNGLRVSALFGWKDTRLMAREWLQIRLPLESELAVESYAEAACIDTWKAPLAINKIERCGITPLVDQGAGYLLRTASISGRGLRNPLTGKLYPEPAKLFQQFLAGSELLCAWAPLPPRGLATFVSPTIELYGLKRFVPAVSLQLELSQPALIVNGDQNQVGRQTFFPVGRRLGSAACLLVDRWPQTIAVGGPGPLDRPVFLVLNTAERPAVVNVRGFGTEQKVALEPYDTRVVPLKRPEWRPRVESFETITLKTDPMENVLYIPCFARIVFTVDEVARLFLDTGRADRIREYFPDKFLEKELNPDVQYITATELGLWPLVDQAAEKISVIQTEIGQGIQADPALVSINGAGGYYYDQFARARLQQPYDFACLFPSDKYGRPVLPEAMKILELQLPQSGEGSEKIGRLDSGPNLAGLSSPGIMAQKEPEYCQRLNVPMLLGRGRYELRGELMLKLKEAETDLCVPLVIRTTQGDLDADCRLELQPGTWRSFSLVFQPRREMQPQIDFRSPAAAELYLKNMEICWSLADTLESVRADLALAAIRHSMHRADWEKASAQLAALPRESWSANELACPALAREIRQMMFACAGGRQDDPGRRQAARKLLELAPGHYPALLALAAEDKIAGELARKLEGNLKDPPLFAPWLALVGFSFNAETREARCVFEALRNETPGLAATFWLQRRGEWRRKQAQSLTGGLWMSKGERVVIVVRLNEAFGQTLDLNKLALGMETDVQWHAGAIPLATGGQVVPFANLHE